MENVDKISLLKELDFYSRLLEKHEALKKEKEVKSTNFKQARIGQQSNNTKHFYNYKIQKNQNNPASYFNQKYSFKNPTHLGPVDPVKKNGFYNQRQTFNSKYSLSKNKVSNDVNKFAINIKSLNSDDSAIDKLEQNLLALSSELTAPFSTDKSKISNNNLANIHPKHITNSKAESIKTPCMPSNVLQKSAFNTKDFIKEVESLTKLLKKKSSGSPHKVLNSASKYKNVMENKQLSFKKDQNRSFGNASFTKKETGVPKTKSIVEKSFNVPAKVNYATKRNVLINSNNKTKTLKQEATGVNRFVYKKSNVKPVLNRNTAALLKNFENKYESMDQLKIVSKPTSRKVIYSNSKSFSHNVFMPSNVRTSQIKPSESHSSIKKMHTPNNIISSNRKVLKMSPHINKIKPPVLFKMKSSNVVKTPKIIKLKQTNSRYKIINKRLITPNKGTQLQLPIQHRSTVKRIKKKVNKYKVINKTLTPISNEKSNASHSTVRKKKSSVSMDCDSLLENLKDSAVEKLEQNLLVISSELTAPLSPESKIGSNNLAKISPKLDAKKTPFKKSKSRISKYKIVNLNAPHKYSLKNKQSTHMTPLKKERTVLVQRLFKSKNAIINRNATPTNYRAKMIKSKYLSFNKRKVLTWQKYAYSTASLHPKLKGSHFTTKLHPNQNRFKTVSTYHSRLIRKTNYGPQFYKNKLIYKNNIRKAKRKINNQYGHSPVVFIRGTRYSKNLNGKTLRKLPVKGQLAKNFRRSNSKLIMRTDLIKTSPASTSFASRVLHRSINRILTASSKKTTSKINSYCMFYNRFGRCNRGVKCSYIHDPSKIAVCTRFLRGTCKTSGCPFSHEVDPGKMAICSFFLVGQCDKENCLYRHEKLSSNAVLCKEFVQGYCHYGKECKKAHILICPKYMQGECDKGSSCAFPHPPQKSKKNIEKEIENEEPKPTEVLLEKVLRYFQQGGDTEKEEKSSNLFVPKQRKLEEQPSFIPLSTSPDIVHNNK